MIIDWRLPELDVSLLSHRFYFYFLHYMSVILLFQWQLEVCLKDMGIWQNVLPGKSLLKMLMASFCSTICHWKVINVQTLELQINMYSIIMLMRNFVCCAIFYFIVYLYTSGWDRIINIFHVFNEETIEFLGLFTWTCMN